MTRWITGLSIVAAFGAACGGTTPTDDVPSDKGSLDIAPVLSDGKSDMGQKAKLLDQLAPDSTVQGTFDPRVRVYGYVVEASKGARLTFSLGTVAGEGATGLEPGDQLDTIMAVYGPYESRREPGELLYEVDDTDEGLAAPPIDLSVEEDGKYMVVFSSWDDTGEDGEYELDIACEGTDYQCRRPQFERPCEDGQLFIQGTTSLDEDTTWDKCEVVILENSVVGPETILTIRPGVEVKSNFLRSDVNQSNFGTVGLDVHGTLQAVGTPDHPIRFTSLTDNGWRGITLRGESNSIQHAFIENAGTGVEIVGGGSAEIADVVIDGLVNGDTERNVRGTQGILAHEGANAVFTRAVVKNFNVAGFRSTGGDHVLIEDSALHDNVAGVRIEGDNASTSCRARVRTPNVWRDPVIRHSDIYDNRWGVFVNGSDELLQIEHSNIVDNEREAVLIQGTNLHEESFIRNSNILRNGRGEIQVRSYHRSGTLDISQNYWEDISDPELSGNWDSRCNGTISFTGFHPLQLDAGPRLETLVDDVKQECLAGLQQEPPVDEDANGDGN
jgi:hypothetical protein